jgi:hypothetical protein
MTRCTFKQGHYNCGSYAFNLYKEDIEQGQYCDHHYWQDQAEKARADERELCARACEELDKADETFCRELSDASVCAATIRART